MDAKTQPCNEWQRLLYDLSSMKAALGLMGIIAGVGLVATLVFPQADVFHSTWFRALLAVFCLNMAFCTFRQVRTLFTLTACVPHINPNPGWHQAKVQVSSEIDVEAVVEDFLKSARYRYEVVEQGSSRVYHADKGLAGRWSTVGVHVALLIIAVGALTGNLFGFTSTILVGQTEAVQLPLNKSASSVAQVTLNDFRIEYYPDGSVSEYISNVSVAADAERVDGVIKVNHPLTFKSVTMYQMGYGEQVLTRHYGPDGNAFDSQWLPDEGKMLLDASRNIELQVIKYVPDFDPHRPSVSRSPVPNNPKVLYAFYQDKEPVDWGVADMGQRLRLNGYDTWVQFDDIRPFSELEVKADPGVPIVMTGLLALSIAFCLSMYLRHHQMCIKISQGSKGASVEAAINRLSIHSGEKVIADLIGRLRKGASTDVCR